MKIDVGLFQLNIERSGNSDGPAVLMAHSLGCDLRMWEPQLTFLEPDYNIIRMDMRGHGLSDAPAGPYTLDQLADDVIAVMDHEGIETAHWVGLSIGGMIGQSLLLRYPDRFTTATLCDTASALPDGGQQIWAERILQVQEHGLGSIIDATLARWFTPEFLTEGGAGVDLVRQQLNKTSDVGYVACSQAITGLDFAGQLSNVMMPVSIIVGRQDLATPVGASEEIHRAIPNAMLTVLENASHISNVEQVVAFNTTLVSFLNSNS